MKKITIITLTLSIILCLITPAYCADTIEPLWDNTNSIFASIDFNGTKGTFTASIWGYSHATDIHVMAWLYYKDTNGNWVEQTTWGALSTSCSLAMERTFTGISGVEYKVDYDVYVYSGMTYDEMHFSTTEVCP